MHAMSTIVMDNNNSSTSNQNLGQLAMINDSGGGGGEAVAAHNQTDSTMNHNSHEVVQFGGDEQHGRGEEAIVGREQQQHHQQGGGPDLIATALDAANIGAQDVAVDTATVDVVGNSPIEEGIIYRNPAGIPPSSANANSKVHFISNLTLIAKQQQHQPTRTGQNIIFLNNAPNAGTSLVATGKGTAGQASVVSANYINAFVSKGATGKVVNLLTATGAQKSVQPLVSHHQRVGKSVQVLKRLPQQAHHSNAIARSVTTGAGQILQPHVAKVTPATGLAAGKQQNVVITGTAAGSAVIGGMKTMAGGKMISTGLYSAIAASSAAAGSPTMKVITTTTTNGQQKALSGVKYSKSGAHVAAQATSKVKSLVSKYQPKVVQVQHHHHQVASSAPTTLGAGMTYTTIGAAGGGAPQWRVDMRGGVTPGGGREEGGAAEVTGIVHRQQPQQGVINVQGAAIATSPTKVITMNHHGGHKYGTTAQQPVLMVSSSGQGGGGGQSGKGIAAHYATHTVQVASSPGGGQYSVIAAEDGLGAAQTGVLAHHQAPLQAGGTIKYVNAQGNVIHQQQHQPATSLKYKTVVGGEAALLEQPQQIHNVIQYGGGVGKKKHLQSSEDVYYVNGTQMNDEMSARLLQSFSQKATSRFAAAAAAATTTTGSVTSPQPQPLAGLQHHPKYQYCAQTSVEGAASSAASPSAGGYAYGGQAAGAGNNGGGSQKHGPEYFRVNTSDIQTTTTTFIDNIPLTSRLEDHLPLAGLNHSSKDGNNNSGSGATTATMGGAGVFYHGPSASVHREEPDQEDIIGVEMRPAPIVSSDERMNALHAVLQDHTYVLLRPGDQKPGGGATGQAQGPHAVHQSPKGGYSVDNKELGIAMAMADTASGVFHHHRHQQPPSTHPGKCTTNDLLTAAMGLGHYPLGGGGGAAMDDDNCSVISNDSRSGRQAGENDLGEETETAPEGEGEDDSVTRCICDLTHDDGYMICCDKCSCWQHVDCMGIDRANIPDEYNCEMCQPRPMDKNKARTLQLLKRREQQNALMYSMAALGSNGALPTPGLGGPFVGGGGLLGPDGVPIAYANGMLPFDGRPLGGPDGAYHRNKVAGAAASPLKKAKSQLARRKSELGATFSVKKQKREMMKNGGVGGKRKEKKTLTKKRTQSGTSNSGAGASSSAATGKPATTPTDEKQLLKSWIDNYEKAITNHYSPELRARLQAIGKQHQHQMLLSPTGKCPSSPIGGPGNVNLRNVGDLAGKCTTVPHAGAKILISTQEVPPNSPIVELRGKYMLSGQYRQHNAATAGRNQLNKPPGPFIFFYRLAHDATELCVDTRTYGNDARFVRRSCRPNAEIVHHLEKGTIHLYIVSLQPIRSSTEITIKHEPHDLLAVSRAQAAGATDAPQPTSTPCACGLVKDCLFYCPFGSTVTQASVGVEMAPIGKPGKRLNGHIPKTRTTSTSRGGDENSGPVRRSKANLRTSRSTSSSGDSSASLMSPNISNGPMGLHPAGCLLSPPIPILPKVEVTANGVLTASAAAVLVPKEEVEKPTEVFTPAVEPQVSPIRDVKPSPCQPPTIIEVKPEPMLVAEVKEEKVQPTAAVPSVLVMASHVKKKEEQAPVEIKMESPAVVQHTTSHIRAMMDSKDVILPPIGAMKSPESSSATTPVKKNKELKSLSEENLKAAPAQAKPSAEESRKLTREERKMEAIMKAFEKMEKSTMRKQENRKGSTGGCDTPGKRRDSTSGGRKDDDRSIFKKKKRKGSKSYQQTNQRRIRRKSQMMANDSDVFTSEESTGSLLASPPISVPFTYATSNPLLPTRPTSFEGSKFNGDQNNAANMLLSLANASPAAATASPTGMSSVFMLVEAAIAPLESQSTDFKVPKTKKSIMNDWLTSDKLSAAGGNSPQGQPEGKKPFESLLQAATVGEHHQLEPQNLCKKVEEFISITGDNMKENCGENVENRILTVPPPFPTPPLTGGSESAVKKRWLRQAISEECSDEAPASPTNGYAATPLKKRRFARQCSDFPEDMSPTTSRQFLASSTNSPSECSPEEEAMAKPFADSKETLAVDGTNAALLEAKLRREKEEREALLEEEIDVINSPGECATIQREDEMVKIEPENEAEKDIRINVEDELPETEERELGVTVKSEEEDNDKLLSEVKQEVEAVDAVIGRESLSATETVKVEKEIIPEEFDIEPLKPEEKAAVVPTEAMLLNEGGPGEPAKVASTASGDDMGDEIADIQKRLHSFHAENILFLKSLNKKTKPNPSLENTPQHSDNVSAYSSASVSASSSAASSGASSPITSPKSSRAVVDGGDPANRRHSTSSLSAVATKRKKLDFDADDVAKQSEDESKELGSPEKRKRRTKSRFSSPIAGGGIELTDLNSNTVGVMKDNGDTVGGGGAAAGLAFKPPEATSAPASLSTHSYYTSAGSAAAAASSYGSGAGHHSLMAPQIGLINTSIPPPHLPYNSMFNAYGGGVEGGSVIGTAQSSQDPSAMIVPSPATSSSRLLLSELLENAQKLNQSFPEMAPTGSFTSSLLDATGLRPSALVPTVPTDRQTGFFTLNATPSLSKMTFGTAGESVSAPGTPVATVAAATPNRTLIRTASADPRLNPNLNVAPETPPAPKRKLSINEYRKRMQQTPTCGSGSNSSSAAASPTGGSSREATVERCDSMEGMEVGEVGKSGMAKGPDSMADAMDCNILDSLSDLKGDVEEEEDSNSCSSSPQGDNLTEENVTFSAAPTLLERQQESISERLKSYKSVTELLTTKDGTPIITTILQNNTLGTSIIESLRTVATTTASAEETRQSNGKDLELNMGESNNNEEEKMGTESAESPPVTTAAAAR